MSKIKLLSNASGTGNVTVTSPATNSDRTITLPDGDGAMPLMRLETAKTATGTAVDFTSIPSWVKRITVMFSGVSTNGTSIMQFQLGDVGGIEATGYVGSYTNFAVGSTGTNLYTGVGFSLGANVSATTYSGSFILSNVSGTTWVGQGMFAGTNTLYMWNTAGNKTLSDTLDRIRITTANGTDVFDAGTINIMYEG
jgi:hypothetical protein